MPSTYLTIDDSPSAHTDAMTSFLVARSVPAILFVRGDRFEKNFDPIVRAVERGFAIGNHSYAHRPAGEMSFDEWVEDFQKTEVLIDEAYRGAGVSRIHRLHRFPYIDRGDGQKLERSLVAGEQLQLNGSDKVDQIQSYLRGCNVEQPFTNTQLPVVETAADCLLTFSSADWMLGPRHIDDDGHPIKTTGDLLKKLYADKRLCEQSGNSVFLMHDQDGLYDVFVEVIESMLNNEFTFLEI